MSNYWTSFYHNIVILCVKIVRVTKALVDIRFLRWWSSYYLIQDTMTISLTIASPRPCWSLAKYSCVKFEKKSFIKVCLCCIVLFSWPQHFSIDISCSFKVFGKFCVKKYRRTPDITKIRQCPKTVIQSRFSTRWFCDQNFFRNQ